jgi:hypothetical protein
LYSGANPIQTGVAPDTIDPKRVVILRGKVLDSSGVPFGGVEISVKDHPELGQTFSRADGMFDLAVNGGAWLTVSYEKPGFVPAQRQAKTEWQEFVWLSDVKMVAYDAQVTAVDLSSGDPMQVARGSIAIDTDGIRQATLLIPQGTSAVMEMPDGSIQPLSTLSIRATEYTVGQDGPKAMPMPLPPSSAYTYALEYSVDEGMASGATNVRFSQPIYHYVENFLGFPVGMNVPVGYYDREKVTWVAARDGRVIEILGLTGGFADLDIDGSGLPATPVALSALGVSDTERQRLATLYTSGTQLWRVPIDHFTPWDANWPYVPPNDATPPDAQPPDPRDRPLDNRYCTICEGSIVDSENQILGERIPIVGTPFTLHYSSDRVPGRRSGTLSIPLSGATIPASLKSIRLTIQIAGQRIDRIFPAQPNLTTTFAWDGKDAYGRLMQGRVEARIQIANVYDALYAEPNVIASGGFASSFARFSNIPIARNTARNEIEIASNSVVQVGGFDARGEGLGGWTVDVHHSYDAAGSVLYAGDGTRRSASSIPAAVMTTVAGTGIPGYSGDGGPATSAQLGTAAGVATDSAGNVFISDAFNHRIRRVDSATGTITTIAGTGLSGFFGDGGPASAAQLNTPSGIAVDPAGNILFSDSLNHRVRRVDASTGIITTIAGTGVQGYLGDEGLATAAQLNLPLGLAVDSAGNVVIADFGNSRIRRVIAGTATISTVAGTSPDPAGTAGSQ